MRDPAISPLFDGLLDVLGDVHGEIDPLNELLQRLGYDAVGRHPTSRRLIFLGDLGDRGPESPAVIEQVRRLVESGRAQCVLGNHELNLLRNESRFGNRWFMDRSHGEQQSGGEFEHSRIAPQELKPVWLEFFASLPLALEREDLRVVHAARVPSEIEAVRRERRATIDIYQDHATQTEQQLDMEGVLQRGLREMEQWGEKLADRSSMVPLLTGLAESDERYQMGNPVRVVTSGVERMARVPFWASGKWRMCERVSWWDEYEEPVPVIIGHYWRQATPIGRLESALATPEAFAAVGPTEWVGPRQNVFCVDFSIGARYLERKAGATEFETHLAAMRWPEKELWFESGRVRH